jgi:ABC-2 type transport system permease protein
METAYFGESLGNIASTIVYTITFVVFIHVIFANVQSIAGYSINQMLFLLFINQLNSYFTYSWGYNNMLKLVADVNRGGFDLTLIKPIPALWYVGTKTIAIVSTIRDATVPLAIFGLMINWGDLRLSFAHLCVGIIILICGQIALKAFFFFLAAPVFWFGQASDLISLGYSFTSLDVPYEGVTPSLRLALTTFIPCLIPTALATSVMLGKYGVLTGLFIALVVTATLLWAKQLLWQAALRNYTSASS